MGFRTTMSQRPMHFSNVETGASCHKGCLSSDFMYRKHVYYYSFCGFVCWFKTWCSMTDCECDRPISFTVLFLCSANENSSNF